MRLTLLLPIFILSNLIVACQKPVEKPVTQDGEIVAVSATSSTSPTLSDNQPNTTASAVATTGTPVEYPFSHWQKQMPVTLSLKDTPAILALLGTPQRTDPKSLDYVGNIATKTSFTAESAPYLEVVDSPQYLELGWYYANPTDSDSEKAASIAHASKIYQIAQGLLGKEGGEMIQDILGGEVVHNKTINGKTVALAKCEFFSCQIIVKK